MRSIVAAMVLLALPCTAQARFQSQPMPSGAARVPGIVEPAPPGSFRLPGMVQVRPGIIDPFVEHDLREAHKNIERRRDNGELTGREARRLRREAHLVARLAYRYGRDGLSDPERRELALRAQTLRSQSGAPRLQRTSGQP